MTTEMKKNIGAMVQGFCLPRYNVIPNVGLYLEQTVKYICEYLAPLQATAITGSMVSNYVKKGLVENPVRKQYGRDQIAYLMFIALAKNVASLDNLALFIRLQRQTYTTERAYNYFCMELENLLFYVFGVKETLESVGVDSTDEKTLLRDTVITLAHKIYLEKCFAALAVEDKT